MPLTNFAIADVEDAATRIKNLVTHTRILSVPPSEFTNDFRLHVKPELFQPSGSFKIRGAFNKVLQLTPEESKNGVVSMSAGNHAIALAMASKAAHVQAVIVMPAGASKTKVDATERLGAQVILTSEDLERTMNEVREARNLVLVHPFDDRDVILGASTVGLELIQDAPHLDAVFIPVGGGGLISGVALAVKLLSPNTRVIGVEPAGANAVQFALANGGQSRLASQSSIADGLKAPYAGALPLQIVSECVDEWMSVSEAEIEDAFRYSYRIAKLACEPSGAVGIAAMMRMSREQSLTGDIATVVTGGNVDSDLVAKLLTNT